MLVLDGVDEAGAEDWGHIETILADISGLDDINIQILFTSTPAISLRDLKPPRRRSLR